MQNNYSSEECQLIIFLPFFALIYSIYYICSEYHIEKFESYNRITIKPYNHKKL